MRRNGRLITHLTVGGKVRYELKTPYRDATTHVIFEPLDFTALAHPCARGISASMHVISRLVVLVPKPRANLTRYHGIFAPNRSLRARVTPAQRGKGSPLKGPDESPDQTPTEHRAAMTWAQRLKRVFNIDVETCRACGGAVKVTALAHSATAPCVALPPASMQSPAPAALVHPCTSLLASKIRRS